jgi:membrane-bound lytic murein transglycosylase B
VITRYNQSVYYAMAVHQLSEQIRSRYERSKVAVDP